MSQDQPFKFVLVAKVQCQGYIPKVVSRKIVAASSIEGVFVTQERIQ
jgi:hypothetical protein